MKVLGFELLRPGYALVLLLLPGLVLLAALAWRRSRREGARLVHPVHRERFWGRGSELARLARTALALEGLGLVLLALLGPVRGHVVIDVPRKGLDLVVCLDASRSMLAEDVRGRARIDEARDQVRGLFEELRGDRVALVSFAGDARRVAPLTRDLPGLARFLDLVQPGQHAVGGTNIAAALEQAGELLAGRSGSHEAILLITDGEDHEARGLEVAQELALRHIGVHVLGVGSEGGAKIPLPEGGFQRDADGRDVVTHLDVSSLQAIASATGGDLRRTDQNPLALLDLYRAGMGGLEGRTYERGKERVPLDRYQWFLAPGLLCLLIAVALPRRGRRGAGAPLAVAVPRRSGAAPQARARDEGVPRTPSDAASGVEARTSPALATGGDPR